MTPAELKHHKLAVKALTSIPSFTQLKKGKLPRPLHKIGGSRFHTSGMIDISDQYVTTFLYRDGSLLTDTAFFGYLFLRATVSLYPLFEFHWHPSHKLIHAKLPCNAKYNYTDRTLPGAEELNLSKKLTLDPRNERDRLELIRIFCRATGIEFSSLALTTIESDHEAQC